MNILLLSYEYPPIGGGGGVGAMQYARAWVRQGHKVTVLTSRAPGLAKRETADGVDIIRVFAVGRRDRATATNLSMLCYLVFGFLYVLCHLREIRKAEVINTHFSIPTGPLGLVVSRMFGIPDVLTIIGGDIYDPSKRSSPHRSSLLRWVNAAIINRATRVVAISSDTKKRAETYYNLKNDIAIINYGFDPFTLPPATRAEFGLKDQSFYLIAVGRLVERKGFEYLIRSLRELPEEIELLLVGDGPLLRHLEECTQAEGVRHRVRFLGYQTRDAILKLLQVADCFVLSSLHEGLGIVVQEAMYVGRPVVATNNGGQVDLIQEGRNGLLVPPSDAFELARAIERVYREPLLARRMAEANRCDIQRCYMAQNCRLYISLFGQAASPLPRASAA